MKKTTLLFLILSSYLAVSSQSGTPDPAFGNNGVIKTYPSAPGPNSTTLSRECFLQADGKLILVLQVNNKTKLTRRLANGNIDASYGTNGFSVAASFISVAAAMQADGKIVAAGTTDGSNDFMLTRFNIDGSLDPSFGNGGVVITDIGSSTEFLNAVVITPGGKIIAGGTSIAGSGQGQFALVQYNSSGTIDNGFGVNGIVLTDINNAVSSTLNALALQSDGKIITAGNAFFNNGNADFAVARYHTDGSPDLSFNLTGQTTSDFSGTDVARSVLVASDGKIYAGGQSVDASGTAHFTVARYNSNGTPDANFNAGSGFVTTVFGTGYEFLTNMALQSDGKLVASGHNVSDPGTNDILLLLVNSNGTIDNDFGSNGNGQVKADINSGDDNCEFLLVQPDGKIVTGGIRIVMTNGFESGFSGFRFNTDGTPDAGFGNGGSFTDFVPNAFLNYVTVFQQTDGRILAVSETNGETSNKSFLNRFLVDGSPDNSFGQSGSLALSDNPGLSFFQPDGKLLRLSFSNSNNGDILLVRNNPDGTIDAGFGNGGTVITDLGEIESPTAAAFQPDGKIIIGGLFRNANGSDFLVGRYHANGSVDAGFGVNGFVRVDFDSEESVQTIAVAPDGKIVFGGTSLAFFPIFRTYTVLARLNANGSIDATFGGQGIKSIDGSPTENFGNLAIQNDNKILFTSFERENTNIPVSYLGRLNTDGNPDNNFGQGGTASCDGSIIVLQADQKIVIPGYRLNNRNNIDFVITRFTSDGNPDPLFGTNGQTTLSFTGLDNFFNAAHLAGNNLYLAGAGVDALGSHLGMITKFVLDSGPAFSLSCPTDIVANTDNDQCSALVNGIDPIPTPENAGVNYQLSGATTDSGIGTASGLRFNTGITMVTYTLTGDATKACSFLVTVKDNKAPVISGLSVSPTTLWPVNHKLKDVTVNYTVSDNCNMANTQIAVSSNEPVQTSDRDDLAPDWQIVNNHQILLRAERSENGNGRIYSIKVIATDVNGNKDSATATVTVPKSTSQPKAVNLSVTAYPNPSTDRFLVTTKSNSDERITVRLLDNKGTILTTMANISGKQTIKIGDQLKPGIYFIQVTQGGTTKTTKLIKQ